MGVVEQDDQEVDNDDMYCDENIVQDETDAKTIQWLFHALNLM